jgi:hypothetical protein
MVQNCKTATLAENPSGSSRLALFCHKLFCHNRGEDGLAECCLRHIRWLSARDGSLQRGEVIMSTSKNLKLTICVGALLAPFLLGSARAHDHNNNNQYSATFSGFQEIGGLGAGETGAIFSPGKGQLSLNVDTVNQKIDFILTYSGLSSNIIQSHIHFGKKHVAGGVQLQRPTRHRPTRH